MENDRGSEQFLCFFSGNDYLIIRHLDTVRLLQGALRKWTLNDYENWTKILIRDVGWAVADAQQGVRDVGRVVAETSRGVRDVERVVAETQQGVRDIGRVVADTQKVVRDVGWVVADARKVVGGVGWACGSANGRFTSYDGLDELLFAYYDFLDAGLFSP